MSNFQHFLQENGIILAEHIRQQCREFAKYPVPNAQFFAKHLEEYTLRGKMLRGSFIRLTTEALNVWDDPFHPVSAALELAQSALLIHDDVMDKDDLRRGKPSMHIIMKNKFSVSEHVGQSLAICLGDAVLFHLFSLVADYPELTKLFAKELTGTALGQSFDILSANKDPEPSYEDIMTVMLNKTAHYTFVLPFTAGAILANKEATIPTWQKLGKIMGLIFQIRDDELNYLHADTSGKSSDGDIRENKKTLCRLELINEKPFLKEFFGQVDKIDEIKKHYVSSVAREKIALQILNYKKQAEQIISSLPIKENRRTLFHELLDYLIERNS